MTPALKIAKDVFTWAGKEMLEKCDLEIFLNRGRGRTVLWSEGKCEDLNQTDGEGVGIRMILQGSGSTGKQGFAFTTSLLKEHVRKAASQAYDSARILPEDPYRKLPLSKNGTKPGNARDLFDRTLFGDTIPHIQEKLKNGEDQILKKYPEIKSILRAGFSETQMETAIVNSQGTEQSFSETYCGFGVSCLAERGAERQEGGFGLSRRFKQDLDWDHIFENASRRTLALLGGKPIPSGNIPVVFDPSVACDFLSLISDMVCAESLQKGKSPFKGKLGKQVASKEVSIIDDGTLTKGLATSPIDDEGVSTQKKSVISSGKLNQFLYDTYTALKDDTSSTGNASRSGFKSPPSSGPSNFYMAQGTQSRQQILNRTKGLYLYDVMGLHMADPISGDFSVGAIGAWIENGEFKSGVRAITLAGNLLDLLKKIDAVCDDLTFFGSLGSPTFRVGELTVSGL